MVSLHPSEKELRAAYAFVRNHPFPSVPEVVNRISEELARPEPELPRLIKLINSDIALAGLVLKTINSAGFGYGEIESVQQAVTLLGLERLKNLIMASYIEKFLPVQSEYAQQILKDSKLLAQTAAMLAGELGGVAADEAYIAGLMLDSGGIFLSEYLGNRYAPVYDLKNAHPITINQIENRRIGANHSIIGYLFARHWNLPENVCLAIYLHHGVPCEQVENEVLRGLLALLKLADYLASRESGAAFGETSMEQVQHLAKVKGELMIDDERIAELEQGLH